MTRPFFSRERITHFDIFDVHAGRFLIYAVLHALTGPSTHRRSDQQDKSPITRRICCRFPGRVIGSIQPPPRNSDRNIHKDLIHRFTLDSATEFLFDSCVHSLRSVLPYPYNAPNYIKNASSSAADDFADAFRDAQIAIANRARLIWLWPWAELFSSKTAGQMKVVDNYLKPILERAVEKATIYKKRNVGAQGVRESNEEDTLLDHLARYTAGTIFISKSQIVLIVFRSCCLARRSPEHHDCRSRHCMLTTSPDQSSSDVLLNLRRLACLRLRSTSSVNILTFFAAFAKKF